MSGEMLRNIGKRRSVDYEAYNSAIRCLFRNLTILLQNRMVNGCMETMLNTEELDEDFSVVFCNGIRTSGVKFSGTVAGP